MKLARATIVGAFTVAAAAACGTQQPSTTQAVGSSLDHPDFTRKLAEGAAYRVNRDVAATESICGQSDLVKINDYTGNLGQPVEYTKLHKFAVGAMASSNGANAGDKYCTGTLVGPDLFITAGHCVDSTTAGHDYVAMNFEYAAGSSTLLAQDFYKITELVEEGGSLDYSVIRLEGNPGLKYGWATLRTNQADVGELITIVQHPGGRAKEVEVGHVAGYQGSYYTYGDLDTEPGSSGSGIVDSKGNLVGIHTNGGCTSTGGTNSGTRLNAARTSAVLSRLANVQLPFQDGSTLTVGVQSNGKTLKLGADVANGNVTLSESEVRSQWQVVDLRDGSFRLKMTDGGRTAYLTGATSNGNVAVTTTVSNTDLGTKWRVVKTDAGQYGLRTVGGVDGPRWLSARAEGAGVGLADQAATWDISVQ